MILYCIRGDERKALQPLARRTISAEEAFAGAEAAVEEEEKP
jgi:hypothetical protein